MFQSIFAWETHIVLQRVPLISKLWSVFSTQASESGLRACSSAENKETKHYFSLTSPDPQSLKIMVFQHADSHTTLSELLSGIMQMSTMFSEALPAWLSCIFHANAKHIVKCKKSIRIDSSWNGAIMFQIYKGNETRRFLRDSWFTVRLF